MPMFTEVSTVNSPARYQNRYDSAIHASDCRDCNRAQSDGCTLYPLGEHADADTAAAFVSEDYAQDFGEDHGFHIIIMPCARAL